MCGTGTILFSHASVLSATPSAAKQEAPTFRTQDLNSHEREVPVFARAAGRSNDGPVTRVVA